MGDIFAVLPLLGELGLLVDGPFFGLTGGRGVVKSEWWLVGGMEMGDNNSGN